MDGVLATRRSHRCHSFVTPLPHSSFTVLPLLCHSSFRTPTFFFANLMQLLHHILAWLLIYHSLRHFLFPTPSAATLPLVCHSFCHSSATLLPRFMPLYLPLRCPGLIPLITKKGNIKNTEELDWTRKRNHILAIVAFDCAQNRGHQVMVNIVVNQ